MVKFKKHKAGRGGWSEWVYPKVDNLYLFKCCDCGLVHEIEFRTFIGKEHRGGTFKVVLLPNEVRPMFRARRMKISQKLKSIVKSLT